MEYPWTPKKYFCTKKVFKKTAITIGIFYALFHPFFHFDMKVQKNKNRGDDRRAMANITTNLSKPNSTHCQYYLYITYELNQQIKYNTHRG
jgi:hypothetical protein